MSDVMEKLIEAGARAAYEADHKGLRNCWQWDDQGLDDEHPATRKRYLKAAEAVLRAALPGIMEDVIRAATSAFPEAPTHAEYEASERIAAAQRARLEEIMEG